MMGQTGGAGGNLETTRSGEISGRGPSSIDYKPVPEAGFKILPAVIRSRLMEEGVIGSKPFCASCLDLKVKRRSDGTHYQVGTAWWCNQAKAVLIECRREMKLIEGKKFSSIGTWKVSGVVHHLGDVGRPEMSKWRFSGEASGRDDSSPTTVTHDPLDLLPPEVAAPVQGGLSDVWAVISESSAIEYLTAIKVSGGDALLLEGTRTATSEVSLRQSEWILRTLRAPIEKSEVFVFELGSRNPMNVEIGEGRTHLPIPGS